MQAHEKEINRLCSARKFFLTKKYLCINHSIPMKTRRKTEIPTVPKRINFHVSSTFTEESHIIVINPKIHLKTKSKKSLINICHLRFVLSCLNGFIISKISPKINVFRGDFKFFCSFKNVEALLFA